MKILVTGAAGLLDLACPSTVKKNYNVIGIDNLTNIIAPNLKKE